MSAPAPGVLHALASDSKSKAEIVIFFIGQSHNDPAVFSCISRKIVQLKVAKVPVSICCEYPADMTLDSIKSNIDEQIKLAQSGVEDVPPQVILGLEANQALSKVFSLVKSHANKDPIPFHAIDCHSQVFSRLGIIGGDFSAKYTALEREKMSTMSSNMVKIITGLKAKSGGVIFVIQLGLAHAHRLAAKTKIALAEAGNLGDIQLFSMITYRDGEAALAKKHLEISKQFDEAAIKVAYGDLPCPTLQFKKLESGAFESPEFEAIYCKALSKLPFLQSKVQSAPVPVSAKEDSEIDRLIASKKSDDEIYVLGNDFRKGNIPNYPKDSREAYLAARKCYQILVDKKYVHVNLHHNMGSVLYYLGKLSTDTAGKQCAFYEAARKHYALSTLGESKRNLEMMNAEAAEADKRKSAAAVPR